MGCPFGYGINGIKSEWKDTDDLPDDRKFIFKCCRVKAWYSNPQGPTFRPTFRPTVRPTQRPIVQPTSSPQIPSESPTDLPTKFVPLKAGYALSEFIGNINKVDPYWTEFEEIFDLDEIYLIKWGITNKNTVVIRQINDINVTWGILDPISWCNDYTIGAGEHFAYVIVRYGECEINTCDV